MDSGKKRKVDSSEYRKTALQNTADVHEVLRQAGVAENVLHPSVLSELENEGIIEKDEAYQGQRYDGIPKKKPSIKSTKQKILLDKLSKKISSVHAKTLFEQVADNHIEVVQGNFSQNPEIVVTPERKSQERDNTTRLYSGGRITKQDWIPYANGNVFELEPDFVKWVDSWFPRGFSHSIANNKFFLYCQQAEDWYQAGYDISNCEDQHQQVEFVKQEKKRFEENSLYFTYKYGRLKDGSFEGGRRRIEPYEAQKLLLYLMDCGLSAIVGKMRQLGITSIIGIGAGCKTMYRSEWFTKYICEDDNKTRSVFEDKIKYPISQTPQYLVPSSFSDQERQLKFGTKEVKGRVGGANSKIEVVPPSATAINSGSPQFVLVDEIGNIPVLTAMINENRPTMFVLNPTTQKIEQRRQLFMWGTGGEMKTDSFESEMTAAIDNWKARNFEYGIVPVFLDAYCKPGVKGKFYESEKRNAYSKSGHNKQTTIAQFHAAYPTHIEDMFIRNVETLIPIAVCNEHLDRINQLPEIQRPIKGRFVPVFDTNSPTPESDLPYAVVSVYFEPMGESEDPPITMMLEPKRNWRNRYFQGTDPINTETGHSKFASAIWDAEYDTFACQLNYRERDFQECYRQSVFMSLYYDTEGFQGCPELVESNIGQDYISYRERKKFDGNMIMNKQLNPMMHVNGARVGISNKAHTRGKIIGKMKQLYDEYGSNIYIEEGFIQMKTFVEKPTSTGGTKWVAADLKRHFDDVLFSQTYAKMAADLYKDLGRYPVDISHQSKAKVKMKLTRDAQGNLIRDKFVSLDHER
jgi:hypothetical protein